MNEKYTEKLIIGLEEVGENYLKTNWNKNLNFAYYSIKQSIPHSKLIFKYALSVKNNELYNIIGIYDPSNKLIGYSISKFFTKNEKRTVKLEFIKFESNNSSVKGIADRVKSISLILAKSLKASNEELEADWIGRYVWAKRNYQFSNKTRFLFNNNQISTLELAIGNFKRFIKHYKISKNDLGIKDEKGIIKIIKIEDIKRPIEFANIISISGRKIKIRPLIDLEKLGESQELDIGKSFMLRSYTPEPNQRNIIYDPEYGEYLSDISMPYWNGEKNL